METGRVGPLHPRIVPADREAGDLDSGKVVISSDPPTAEIFTDEKFAGQTPSTIPLRSGTHHVEIRMHGRQTWQRDLEIA